MGDEPTRLAIEYPEEYTKELWIRLGFRQSILKAMTGVIMAQVGDTRPLFMQFCPSHDTLLELEIHVGFHWWKEDFIAADLWLREQKRIRRLVWSCIIKQCPLPVPKGAFPNLRSLTCPNSIADELLYSRLIHTFRCTGDKLGADELEPLLCLFSHHLRKVQLPIKLEDAANIIKLLVTVSPHLTVLKLALSGIVKPCDIQATAGVSCFPDLRVFSLRFLPKLQEPAGTTFASDATEGTPVKDMIRALRKTCHRLEQVTLGFLLCIWIPIQQEVDSSQKLARYLIL
ncbi:hypothetical protein FRB93_002796 [Tulasnella sp. JGI-2019a]|nr:hypothetical protein FRB93_002796 [Tulasnella sp. JGI-2019a]